MSPRAGWLGATGFFLFNLAIRLPALHQPIDRDLAAYATIGQQMGRGLVPYLDVFDHKQPLTYPLYWLLTTISAHSNEVIRVAAAIVAGAAVAALFWFLFTRVHWATATATAIFASLAGASRYVEGVDLNTEHVLVLTGAIAILLSLSLSQSPKPVVPLIVGIAVGFAIMTKASGSFLAPAALVPLISTRKLRDQSLVRTVALYGSGVAVPIAATAGLFAALGAWQEFVYANITYNRAYVASTPHVSLSSWFDQPMIFRVFIAVGIVAFVVRLRRVGPRDPVGWCALLWLIGAFLGAELSNRGSPHYFAPLTIPIALLLCLPFWGKRDLSPRLVNAGVASLLVATAPFAIDVAHTVGKDPDALAVRMYGDQAGIWALQDEAGAFLRDRARAGDRLMVAEAEPGFYWTSGIQPASRYIYDYPWQFEPRFFEQVADDLDPPPRFVVLPRGGLPAYMDVISSHPYELVHTIGPVQILELSG